MSTAVTEAAEARTELLIGGEWRPAGDGGTITDLSPVSEEPIAEVAAATAEDVDAAVRAARGQVDGGAWSQLPAVERGRLIAALGDLVERDAETLCRLETIDVGKPIGEPRTFDVPLAVSTLRYFAGWADKIEGRAIPTPGFMGRPTHNYTVREPLGVVAQVLPWNAPTMLLVNKLAPALAAGCSVVIKPAEDAPLAPLHVAWLAKEAGFPPGTVNIVPGDGEGTGTALVRHPGIDKVSFTGSVEVGREIQALAAPNLTRVALELGGKSPQIVLPDADLEAAIGGIAMGLFANQGEVCAAGTRVLVHRSLHDQVVEALAGAAGGVKVGDPLDPETTMGPLINGAQLDRVLGYIESGREEGAKIVAGGGRPDRKGFYVEPTIFADATNSMKIAQEEIFGPVGTVIPFDEPEEAITLANDSAYGLTAAIWTSDVGAAHRMAARVRAGVVWINGWGGLDPRLPFGGVKSSGYGREMSRTAIDEHTEEKLVSVVL